MPKVAPSSYQAVIGPDGASQGQSGSVKTTLSQYEYELVYFGTQDCFSNISTPENGTEMILYSEFTDESQFSEEKNCLEICFFVSKISNKYESPIFLKTPCSFEPHTY